MELGNGIADILFGKESPAGRTNMTWYGTNKQFPEMEEYDIIQKNRTYQYDEDGICYPFGYGLSYTTFAYRNMSVTCRDFTHINISVDVENTGAVVSDEVAQIYYRKENSEVKRPYKTLVAFERVKNIMPGEVRHLDFVVSQEQLKYFDVICEGMLLESGEYCFMAGSSSQDIMTQKSIVLQGEKRPNRDGFSRNQAQNYDRSEGIVLDCGQKVRYGKLYRTVVCTKNGVEDVCLSYDKMYLENEAKQLVLDFWQEYLCDIEILAGDKSIGTFRIGKPEEEKKEYQVGEANGEGAFQCHENWLTKRREIGFREIAIPLSEVPIKKEFTLTIRWNGKGKLSTYQFA